MAPLRHAAMCARWSLSGGKRTSRGRPVSVAIDPLRTLALARKPARSARTSAVRSVRLPRSIAGSQGAAALGFRQTIIESLEILKAIERGGWKRPLGRFFSIIRGASDNDGANEVPRTRCRSASSRHWCTDCRLPGFGNLHSDRTARNSRDRR
jgi:hypothetical protein